ncbi:hypothetical protein [Allobaculum sp. JKK-2023]|uniref:hypothetical protein n=1 Tax=Allobaculum sp. JKK-2023 TaxID=3108943 RepID=UPI002B057F7D|nr:hypothetical protein [Allobaculum sp. JKK-2023]
MFVQMKVNIQEAKHEKTIEWNPNAEFIRIIRCSMFQSRSRDPENPNPDTPDPDEPGKSVTPDKPVTPDSRNS